jgi:hypothetical protein
MADGAHLEFDDGFGGPQGDPRNIRLHQFAQRRERNGDCLFQLIPEGRSAVG